ncbi:MAG TPA: PQQ-dependent dehydrogenase, methanol/ethanol family, partial [Candidatus Limnocylindrales bacterium]|nr:PQQ-dependent dehydrogenase, methanol/ethanol family [Candidatus Limnocylindrales bacterium]
PLFPEVTAARLAAAATDDGWLMFRRSYDSQGYAPFGEITPANVSGLQPVFTYATGMPQGHEAAPIVNGRTMIVTTPLDHVVALDAASGRVLWTYVYPYSLDALRSICCDVVNRGVALYGANVYLGTIDDHLLALDAQTGRVVWNTEVAPKDGHYAITGAPLAVEGKIVIGVAGGEYGARGFLAAFDAVTGKRVWKRWTIPAPNEPGGRTWPPGAYKRGGGPTWLTGSYDARSRTLFWGTGNPGPWFAGFRPGDNLYSNSLLALNVDTGAMKWFFQYTPHDTWDYDGVNELVLVDLQVRGATVPAIVHADRNGYFFALDRRNGRMIYARPFVKQTTIRGYTAAGRAIVNSAAYARVGGPDVLTCPSASGGKNWYPVAYSPQTQLAYVPILHLCARLHATGNLNEAFGYYGEISTTVPEPGSSGFGELSAIDVKNGRKRWSFPSRYPWTGGVLATASGVVFSGNSGGLFYAFDARSGKVLWQHRTSSGIIGVPTTYRVGGKQYVAVYAGYGGGLAMFGGPAAALTSHIPRGGRLYVFALGGGR